MAKKETQPKKIDTASNKNSGKGRATPTRKEAESARQRPLVPSDRKLAKKIEREKRNETYQKEQLALQTGDERYLPWRDKGKVRRFSRDWVDARWSISEFLLPGMLLFLIAMLGAGFIDQQQTTGQMFVVVLTIILYCLFGISALEGVLVWLRIKKKVQLRYPDEAIPKGTWFYTYSRMLMARRWRSPKPQVARGEFPAVPDQTRL